ncbi:MAG TPA: flagellar export chaperone FlgN [Tepidisphaeraceae bacterium]|nr:flagellar export chaperone FlgN [Tepidisphaeraceae bacterium]
MRQLTELEVTLQQLTAEHHRLIKHMDAHQAAMKAFDLGAMDTAAHQQEAARLRIGMLENKRKTLVGQISQLLKHEGAPLTITRIAELNPQRGPLLMKLRDELKTTIQQTTAKSHIAGKLAGAVLGHLNTVVRLLAGSVENAGVYSKHGVPQVSARIGVMEAVG